MNLYLGPDEEELFKESIKTEIRDFKAVPGRLGWRETQSILSKKSADKKKKLNGPESATNS